jgi:two-component system, chemotaxis family, protein-glutamate methylesterase/glutaminase
LEVIGRAKNGLEAVAMAAVLKPDLITMDVEMPELDGVEATRQIMIDTPTPIVVISSHVSDTAKNISFRALDAGALTVLAKPTNVFTAGFEEQRSLLIRTVRAMAEIKLVQRKGPVKPDAINSTTTKLAVPKINIGRPQIVGIVLSTGGPQSLKKILENLPNSFPIPICIVQHIAKGFLSGMVSWLKPFSTLPLEIACDSEIAKPGIVYFAPEDLHLLVKRHGASVQFVLDASAPVSGFCPSGTPLLHSLAQNFGRDAIGAILTGMGDDGAIGLLELNKTKGHTFAQDETSSIVFGMPREAVKIGATDTMVGLNDIAQHLSEAAYGAYS